MNSSLASFLKATTIIFQQGLRAAIYPFIIRIFPLSYGRKSFLAAPAIAFCVAKTRKLHRYLRSDTSRQHKKAHPVRKPVVVCSKQLRFDGIAGSNPAIYVGLQFNYQNTPDCVLARKPPLLRDQITTDLLLEIFHAS